MKTATRWVIGMLVIAGFGAVSVHSDTITTNLVVLETLNQGDSMAVGSQATALGNDTEAYGDHSLAIGDRTAAMAPNAYAGGQLTEVRSNHPNAFIHAVGTTNLVKDTLHPHAGHFDHILLLENAYDDPKSVLTRAENDARYIQPGVASTNAIVAPQFQVVNNTYIGTRAAIGGGQSNVALGAYSTIGGGATNTAVGSFSVVAGGYKNFAHYLGQYATIGGGAGNQAENWYTTVAGGSGNRAAGSSSFIGGGAGNITSNGASSVVGGSQNQAVGHGSVVAGGYFNFAQGARSGILAGHGNTAVGDFSSIAGGTNNAASGYASFVGGGRGNLAQGAYSYAGGYMAQALHDGSFVWADATSTSFASITNNEFAIRATSGVRVVGSAKIDGPLGVEGLITATTLEIPSGTNNLSVEWDAGYPGVRSDYGDIFFGQQFDPLTYINYYGGEGLEIGWAENLQVVNVNGSLTVNGGWLTAYVPPQGGLSMGSYTNGPKPQ